MHQVLDLLCVGSTSCRTCRVKLVEHNKRRRIRSKTYNHNYNQRSQGQRPNSPLGDGAGRSTSGGTPPGQHSPPVPLVNTVVCAQVVRVVLLYTESLLVNADRLRLTPAEQEHNDWPLFQIFTTKVVPSWHPGPTPNQW